MKSVLAMLILFLTAVAMPARSQQAWDAKTIVWQDIEPDGTKYALLEGDRNTSGKAFTYAFFIPAGYWEHHWHTQDARVPVVSGALKVSFAEKLHNTAATPHPPA